ncbi:MAG: 50S ribosomal protein L3 [Candidatus Pacearchaeota archaeon]
MTNNNRIHKGSLQFYPRVRAKKVIPSVNWKPVKSGKNGLLGFIGYKVGMVSVYVKDNTDDSMTKNKRIVVPATIIECPAMRIYSVRFYKNGRVSKEFIVSKEKELKRKLKVPKETKQVTKEDFDDVRVILYSIIKNTSIGKKKPNLLEIALSGSNEYKMKLIQEKVGKDISLKDIFEAGLVDIRAVTTGYGTQGPVRRFGISLKSHKSEKGRRRPGSLAPWHPARVTFRTAQAGQTGYQNRISYNNLILYIGRISDKDINKNSGFEHYGKIKNDYLIVKGSVPGPVKRGLVITFPIKPTKKQSKKKFEFIELR